MIGGLVTILVVLALIAVVWGRPTAKGCASWLVGTAFALVALVLLAAMGVSPDTIGAVLKWSWIAAVVGFVGFVAFAKMDDFREDRRAERRRQERASREEQTARAKVRKDEEARAVLEAERDQRMSAPERLREALDAGDLATAYDTCRQCAWDWDIVALEWREPPRGGGQSELITWSQLSPPPSDDSNDSIDGARLLRLSRSERDATLRGVLAPLEEAVRATADDQETEDRAALALLALAGFSNAVGDADAIVRRVTRLLHGVLIDPTSQQPRRVFALVVLGTFGSETTVFGAASSQGTPPVEPLGEYLSDDDPEIRAAAAYAIGRRLLLWADADEREARASAAEESLPDDLRLEMEATRRTDEAWGRQYVRTAAALLRPLLDGDPDEYVRATVARALASVEDGAVRAALRKRATDPDEAAEVRRAATDALRGALSRPDAQPADDDDDDGVLSDELAYLQRYVNRSEAREAVQR